MLFIFYVGSQLAWEQALSGSDSAIDAESTEKIESVGGGEHSRYDPHSNFVKGCMFKEFQSYFKEREKWLDFLTLSGVHRIIFDALSMRHQ